MDMAAKDHEFTRQLLEVVAEPLIPGFGRRLLRPPVREWVCPRCSEAVTVLGSCANEGAAGASERSSHIPECGADWGGRLDLRLHQLGLDIVAQGGLRRMQQTLRIRMQFAGSPINDLVFLFHAQRPRFCHTVGSSCAKAHPCWPKSVGDQQVDRDEVRYQGVCQ